ncbi:MAG TPA: type II toxin-antitoxin system VapC family toxin [Micromonosporaceae bacterium]|nr:type II toxin-antitoxin system VapC family toxin [Micromonosporaceae bacterium]
MIYLDTSAILKLLRREAETDALLDHLDAHAQQDLITSALATVETARALTALGETEVAARAIHGPDRINVGTSVIPALAISTAVLDLARPLPSTVLRSLDAIHIATAKLAETSLDHLITYDKRMLVAADAVGLRAVAPY